jgi:hypothetical protein
MALDYKNYKYGHKVSADSDTVESAILNGVVVPEAPTAHQLLHAAEWLALYASEESIDVAQSFANVIAFLELTAQSKEKRSALAEAKRKFAKENGIKVSQVRIKK